MSIGFDLYSSKTPLPIKTPLWPPVPPITTAPRSTNGGVDITSVTHEYTDICGTTSVQFVFPIGPLSDATLQRLNNATPNQLEIWSLNLLDADTLDDVFAS